MTPCDLIVAARWTVPVVPAGQPLDHHALVVTNGRIVALGPEPLIQAEFEPRIRIDRPNHLMIPGFINAHTHAGMTLFRGLAEDLPLESWLKRRVFPLEQQWVSAELVRDATRLACAEMSAGGITTFADMYFFPDAAIEAAREARMRIVAGLPATNTKTPWADGLDDHLQKSLTVFDQHRSAANVSFQFTPDSTNWLADAELTRVKTLADQLDLFVHTHFQETQAQAQVSVEKFGATPIERLQQAGLLNERLSGAHAVYLSPQDLTAFAAAGAHVIHCPTSNAKLAAGSAPICDYLNKNVVVALGTDSALSNNALDMFREMRSAAMIARLRTADASSLDAHQCLAMATIGGARALGLSHDVGSLEVGKVADFACVNLDEPSCWPVYDPVTQLVFAADRQQVSDTWVAGEAVYSDNKLQHLDLDWVRERALEWFQRIQPPKA